MSTDLSNEDIRAKILQELYVRRQAGQEIPVQPHEYARLLGLPEDKVAFNIQYLIDVGLVKGGSSGSLGTTKRWYYVTDLTARGIDAVEGRSRTGFAVNFNIINVNAPVSGGQIASGGVVTQNQAITVNSLKELEEYLDRFLSRNQTAAIKDELRQLEKDKSQDIIRPSRLNKIKELATILGPPAAQVILDFVRKYYLGS